MTDDHHPTRVSASEFVANTLRHEILRGDLLPGQPLLQDHIATRFAVSQSSVREALRRLEGQTLAYSVRNRGTFVTGLSVDQVEEIYDLRLAIELMSLRFKFPMLTPDDLERATYLLNHIDESEQIAFAGDTHKKFHSLFFEAANRKVTNDILHNLYGNLTRVWMAMVKRQPSLARVFDHEARREHRELLGAAREGDLDKAEAILKAHICRARDSLVSHLRQFGTEGEMLGPYSGVKAAPASQRQSPRVGTPAPLADR